MTVNYLTLKMAEGGSKGSGYGGGITREEEAERRQVRRRYNDLKQRVKNRRFQQVTDLSDVIKETDELLEEVERKDMTAREAVLDANVFKLISTRCREQAQVSKLILPDFIWFTVNIIMYN